MLCECLLLRRCAVHHQQVGVAAGQHAATANADAGLREKAVGSHLDDAGQLHPANLEVLRRGEHAGFGIGPRRVVAGLGQVHFLAVEPGLVGIGLAIERRVLFARDFLAGVHHRREGLPRVIGKARTRLKRLDIEPVVKQKIGCLSIAHGGATLQENQRTSNTPAAPMPPPTHIVTTTSLAPRRLPSMSA